MDPEDSQETEPADHAVDQADAVATRPIGTRSFVYGAKTLAAALVALLLRALVGAELMPAFWVLLAAGALGLMFSLIERSTTRGGEVVNHRRVNIDVLITVVLATIVTVVVAVVQR